MKRKAAAILLIIALVALWRWVWIYMPSEMERICYVQETGETIREQLSYEETVAVKKVLWGHPRWPQWLYGYPACGFGDIYGIVLDGECYMPAWDSCEMVAVSNSASGADSFTYMNITRRGKELLDQVISGNKAG